ncbi:hypothetical protein JGU66_04710 [Myxococcaceae bacterium JPH2]|nr:hypothetical protein [Myxococcaceae bacterium JPH2]
MDRDSQTQARKLTQALALLAEGVQDREARCVLHAGGPPDETMVLGTRDGLVNLAALLLKLALASPASAPEGLDCYEEVVAEEPLLVTNDIKQVVSEQGDVWLVAACLARDAQMLERVVSRLQAHHGLR